MNKIIEFFNSELCFWINLSLALIGISLWFLNWVLLQKRLKRERFFCNIPGVLKQRPDNYVEDKLDET